MQPGSERSLRPQVWRQRQYLTIFVVLALIAVYFQFGAHLPVPGAFGKVDLASGQTHFNEWLLLSAVTTSFYLVFGIGGRFAFSMAAFYGLGAYVSHWVTRTSRHNFLIGTAVAVCIAAVIALGFAVLVRRAHHFYFAVATLGLAEVFLLLFQRVHRLTGKSSAEISGSKKIDILGWAATTRYRHFWVIVVALGLVLLIAALIERSAFATRAIASRDNPVVSETLAIDSTRPGIVLFVLGSSLAAMVGSLFVHTRSVGTPETFGLKLGIGIFVALILGGLHSMWGGVIGAWFYTFVPLYLTKLERWTQVIWGLVLVVVMIAMPEGLVGAFRWVRGRLRRRVR